MKRIILALFMLAFTTTALAEGNRWIVLLNSDADVELPRGLAKEKRIRHLMNAMVVVGDEHAVNRLKNNPHVQSIEPDTKVQLLSRSAQGQEMVEMHAKGGNGGKPDKSPSDGTCKGGPKQCPPAEEPVVEEPVVEEPPVVLQPITWNIERVGGHRQVQGNAWVLDTGVDQTNPDLILGEAHNFVSTQDTVDDLHGHGTHVAGIIGALDNEIDVVGVAPGVTIHSVRVLDSNGSGWRSWVIYGMDLIAQRVADLESQGITNHTVNISIGMGTHHSATHEFLELLADVAPVAVAAGNSGDSMEDKELAHVEHPNVYTVSAMDNTDTLAWFSCYGMGIDYAAPGVAVPSLKLGGGIVEMSGTSMAAPHVAGILLHGVPAIDGFVNGDVNDSSTDPIAILP